MICNRQNDDKVGVSFQVIEDGVSVSVWYDKQLADREATRRRSRFASDARVETVPYWV
jgi:hypothetical protein